MASTEVSGLIHGPRRPARRSLIMCGYHRFRLFQALGLAFFGTNICKFYFIVFYLKIFTPLYRKVSVFRAVKVSRKFSRQSTTLPGGGTSKVLPNAELTSENACLFGGCSGSK